jgi:T5SS/PEP-CTERM-associated repeat protein
MRTYLLTTTAAVALARDVRWAKQAQRRTGIVLPSLGPASAGAILASLLTAFSFGVSKNALAQTIIDTTVNVPPTDLSSVSGDLFIGYNGAGTLNITTGGSVSNTGSAVLAVNEGSTGTVTVRGPNAQWTIGGHLDVGSQGTGNLTIENGGSVTTLASGSSGAGRIGENATGTVTISGPGSSYVNNGAFFDLGVFATGTLNVTNGGAFSTTGDLDVGVCGRGVLNIMSGGTVTSARGLSGLVPLSRTP